jgi:hypothetical protein
VYFTIFLLKYMEKYDANKDLLYPSPPPSPPKNEKGSVEIGKNHTPGSGSG